MWTQFWDMSSGGSRREQWRFIYIEATNEEQAIVIFYNRFGHDPYNVTCRCCGSDYSIDSDESLAQLTGYHRNCNYNNDGYVEEARNEKWAMAYITLEDYIKQPDVLVIYAKDVEQKEILGCVPSRCRCWL